MELCYFVAVKGVKIVVRDVSDMSIDRAVVELVRQKRRVSVAEGSATSTKTTSRLEHPDCAKV